MASSRSLAKRAALALVIQQAAAYPLLYIHSTRRSRTTAVRWTDEYFLHEWFLRSHSAPNPKGRDMLERSGIQ